MRCKHTLALGLFLALPVFVLSWRLDASDGILSRLHHHNDCDAKQTVVRLPAQEIRVETTQPRVIVNSGSHHRMRGFMPVGQAFAPIAQGPFVATFVPMTGMTFGGGQTTAGSPALDAVHALERQHLEFARQKASLKAEMDHVDNAYKRVHSSLTTPSSDTASIQKSLDELSKRVSDIERLLIIHDNILKEKPAPK